MAEEDNYPELPTDSEYVLSMLENGEPDHVDFSLEFARALFRDELDRSNEIEKKASLLVGAGGVAAATFTALAGLLLRFPSMLPAWSQLVFVFLFVFLAMLFFLAIVCSLRVLRVGKTSYPGPPYSA